MKRSRTADDLARRETALDAIRHLRMAKRDLRKHQEDVDRAAEANREADRNRLRKRR